MITTKVSAKGNDGKAVITFNVGGHPSSKLIFQELKRWRIVPTTHTITITYKPHER